MIDFSTLKGLTIPEGNVTQITDASGRVIWAVSGGKAILEVEKIVSNTYAGETLYENEEFFLLDIYPKTNGTVKVTYDGLTKTITDTSGAEEPNAQQVFFGTFNGVSDSVATAASGELTIEGDYYAFGCASFKESGATKGVSSYFCGCIAGVANLGNVTYVPLGAFGGGITLPKGEAYKKIESITIPKSVTSIGSGAFPRGGALASITFENTNGWYAISAIDGTKTNVDVSDAAANVTLFTETYMAGYTFYRE